MASAFGLLMLWSASLALNAATWSNAEGEPAQAEQAAMPMKNVNTKSKSASQVSTII